MRTAISLLALFANHLGAKTVDESSTGALLSFPSVVDGPLYNQTYDAAPSQFGFSKYGGTLEGWLVLPSNESYHKECPTSDKTPEGQEPIGNNEYIHYIQDWFKNGEYPSDYILVVDRLDCYFVEKIEHAQLLGASGVIICDWRVEHLFTMWMPQDWRDDIDIPSVLLTNNDCATLMQHLGVQNWNPSHPEDMIYPSVKNMNWTIATIEWGLPHPDDTVEYELWTSSNDYLGSRFKHNFNTTAIALDEARDTVFTPHMYILNGSHWGCDDTFNGTHTLPCNQQCTNNGRYCAVDPEYDMSIGLDGMDVIQENLRSLCVWDYDKQQFPGDDVMWWDYAVLWDENCGVLTNESNNFHENCSYAQMETLKGGGALTAYVQNCIVSSGGYGLTDGKNSLLDSETRLKYTNSIYAVPMIRVNEFLIHGNIDCEPPITVATCEVLAAICAGFIDGTQPDVCFVTPAPTMAVCVEEDKDCNGTCFGRAQTDACDRCLLVSDPQWNACIGCNGLPDNEEFDCSGACGGHYAINTCGYCKDTNAPDFATFGVDCAGGCSMTLFVDECGNCIEESNAKWNDCVDCDGVVNGNKEENGCGFCIVPGDNFEDYGKDCNGVCEGDWTYDQCGSCLSPGDETRNACVGCDGVANSGKTLNPCGSCQSITDAKWNDYGRDCRGECSANIAETYYVDDCGQCLLPSSHQWNNCIGTGDVDIAIKSKENELTIVIVIVGIVAFCVVVAAVAIIGALWKKQTGINERFDSLAATYVHMDENPAHNFPMGAKQQTIQSVPDNEAEDE